MAGHVITMKRVSVFPIIGLLWMTTCHAELNVIADLGGKDASPFYESNEEPRRKQRGILKQCKLIV
ncbi:hypothetical protein ACNFJN_06185 [Xenorhabdus budapestensis]|uniref:hypothetical protein n=1 Tax=Xenorhabdus budapestensis TaxID=290110 RepID=UPI003A85E142